jgi:hypothetical protein
MWVIKTMRWPLCPRERDSVPTVEKAGWAPGPVRTGAENLAPTEIGSTVRPACSESLNPGTFYK